MGLTSGTRPSRTLGARDIGSPPLPSVLSLAPAGLLRLPRKERTAMIDAIARGAA